MAVKLTEQTNGPHIFMRLRLDSGRVEEIDAYISEEGWRYVTSADRTPEVRLRIIAAFHIGGFRTLFIHGLYHTTICVIGIVRGIAFGVGAGDCAVQSIVGIAGGIAVAVSRGNRVSLIVILEGEGISRSSCPTGQVSSPS